MKWTILQRDTINRAWECIKKHPELGRIQKKDIAPLESSSSEGLIRTFLVKDSYSGREIFGGESSRHGTYYHAEIREV